MRECGGGEWLSSGEGVGVVGHEGAGHHCHHVVVVGQLLLSSWVRG
jgi:hypothetical protein